MNVYTIHEPERQTFRVYIELGDAPDGTRLFNTYSGDVVHVPRGAEPPMWIRIPDQVAGALAEALSPRPVATERHLDDAIEVRDRLLFLVENLWKEKL